MPKKVKWGIDNDEPEAATSDFGTYDGPVPPKAIYACVVKKLWLTTNKNDDQMIKGIVEIADKGDKAKFNGYAIWFNQNVTEQGAPYLKAMLDALGVSWDDFYGKTVVADEDDNLGTPITKIGKTKIGDNAVRINAKRGSYQNEPKLEVQAWLPPKDDDDEDDAADDADETPAEDDDDEPPF